MYSRLGVFKIEFASTPPRRYVNKIQHISSKLGRSVAALRPGPSRINFVYNIV